MNINSVTYADLASNILKRLLLLCGKLAGYKGFAVLVATVLLKSGYIGEAAWASVVVSALCGMVVPKAFNGSLRNNHLNDNSDDCFGNDFYDMGEKYERISYKGGGVSSASVRGGANAGRRAVTEGKQRIRDALGSAEARQNSGSQGSGR